MRLDTWLEQFLTIDYVLIFLNPKVDESYMSPYELSLHEALTDLLYRSEIDSWYYFLEVNWSDAPVGFGFSCFGQLYRTEFL